MNIKEIKVNQSYNYTQLCTLLGESKKKTTAKKERHLQQFKRYFNWEQIGERRYLITEIYSEPKPEIINSKKSKYMNYFGYILLNTLRKYDNEVCWFKQTFMEIMNIKTKTYINYANENDFYDDAVDVVNYTIANIFNSCLNQMINKEIIKVEKVYVSSAVSEHTGKTTCDELTDDDKQIYIDIENNVFFEYAMDHRLNPNDIKGIKKHISVTGNWGSHYNRLNSKIKNKMNKDIRIKIKVSLINEAIYDVNPDTVYDDLNAAINKRLIEVAEKYSGDDKEEILKIAELNSIAYVPQRTITQSEIDELETVYKDCAWDNNDEVVPDDFEFYESKHKNKRTRRCLDDYA